MGAALWEEGAALGVGVSGGGDSVALLHMLATGALRPAPSRLAALHVDHGQSEASAGAAAAATARPPGTALGARADVARLRAELDRHPPTER